MARSQGAGGKEILAGQKRFQEVQTYRLGEEGVEAGFLGSLAILYLIISRQGHQKAVLEAKFLAHVAGQSKTVHSRHTDVADHNVGGMQAGQGQRCPAVVRGSHFVAGELEQERQAIGRTHVVINEKDSSPWCSQG